MSKHCGCGDSDCPTTVHKNVCVQAQVTITPKVTSGPSKLFCLGKPKFKPCSSKAKETCTFTVSQKICVQIPLTFSASATAVPTGVVYGKEKLGQCSNHGNTCIHRIRYFKKHPEVIEWLIKSAGGSIVLGKVETNNGAVGASITVTTANAKDVLSLNIPSPPVPGSSAFGKQYRQLYAHLLVANLNVLNGATCPFAISAIAAANQFLADSPSGVGMAGGTIYTTPLEQFNCGKAPGCPSLCKKTKKISQ